MLKNKSDKVCTVVDEKGDEGSEHVPTGECVAHGDEVVEERTMLIAYEERCSNPRET